jgi:hypothetical protein
MSRMIFVNLPVSDLARAVSFWTGLGMNFDPRFTDEDAACLVLSDSAYVMLLTERFFGTFTDKPVADTRTHAEAILALSAADRDEVDRLVDRALVSGGAPAGRTQDEGFVYTRSFEDPDGHLWEVLFLDPTALEEQV